MRINEVIKSLSASNAAIKNTASPEPKEGWYPTYSASGQDVWLPDYRFDQKGIVVSAVGARCGKAFKADGKWNVCANTHPLSVDEAVADRDYCWYMLNNEDWWIKGGTAQPFVKVKDSLNREHEFPPVTTQKRIVSELDQISSIITLRKIELEKLDELVKARFVEMFEGKQWQSVSAGSIMHSMRNGMSPSNKGTITERVLTLSAITHGQFDATAWKDGLFDECPPKDKRISKSDFYMCRGNGNKDLVGTGVYSSTDMPTLVFPDTVIAASVDEGNICLPFLHYEWKQPAVRRQIEAGARTTNGTYKVNQKVLSGVEIILPPLALQRQFSDFVAQLDKSKIAVQKAIEKDQFLFDSLMQQYFG